MTSGPGAERGAMLGALVRAGVPVLYLNPGDARPVIELLVRLRHLRAAHRVLDATGWRWRTGGEGQSRLTGWRWYQYDSGLLVTVRRLLGPASRRAAPLASRVARGVARRAAPLRAGAGQSGWGSGGAVVRCRFMGLELLAGPGTFLPRAASERLVGAVLARVGDHPSPVVVDVGTGCGAVGVAVARLLPSAAVVGIDVDPGALSWARRNAGRLGVSRVALCQGSLLAPLPAELRGRVSTVVANVPLVPPSQLAPAADAPPSAYAGVDADGLGLHRRLAAEARSALCPGGHLVLQLAPGQWPLLVSDLAALGYIPEGAETEGVAAVGVARRL